MARVALLRLLLATVGPAAAAATAVGRRPRRVVMPGRPTDQSGWTLTYPAPNRPPALAPPDQDLAPPSLRRKPGPLPTPDAGVLIGYARCSTDKQDLAAQRQTLRAL